MRDRPKREGFPVDDRCLTINTRRRTLALAAVLLFLTAGVFFFQNRARQQSFDELAERHIILTSRTAAELERQFRSLQEGLRQLASGGNELLKDREFTTGDFFTLDRTSSGALLTLYLQDPSGNILLEFPRGTLAASGFPVHLLHNSRTHQSTSDLLYLGGGAVLRLSEPVFLDGERTAELTALVPLDRLRDRGLGLLPPSDDFLFLLDDSGYFVVHRDSSLIGRKFTETLSPADHPELYRFYSDIVRGDYGCELYFGALGPSRTGDREMLACAPIALQGARWNLGLTVPSPRTAALGQAHDRALFFFAAALLSFTLLAFPVRRLRRLPVETKKNGSDLDGEISRLHAELTQSRTRAQHLLDHAGDAIFFIDPFSGAIEEVNRRAEELLGYRGKEIRALSPAILFPGNQQRRYLRLVKRVLRDGYGEERNLVFRCKEGRRFPGEVHARLGRLGEKQVVHGVLRDMTEVIRIEQELRQRNRDLTLMNEIAHLAAGNRDLQEMLRPVLHRIILSFGSSGGGIFIEEENGRDLLLAVHQGIAPEIVKEIERLPEGEGLVGRVALTGKARSTPDTRIDRRIWSDKVRGAGWEGLQGIPLTANEKTVGVLFLFGKAHPTLAPEELDLLLAVGKQVGTAVEGARLFEALQRQVRITRATNQDLEHSRRQLRENLSALEEANRALSQLDRMKSHFLALASHELRTPLTYILSGTELLDSILGERLHEDERRTLEVVFQGGQRLKEIVEDLLEAARIESQSLYLAREPVEVSRLLQELQDDFQPVLQERSLKVRLQNLSAATTVNGDAHHLKKTFQRLVENAVKFTPEGGRIEVRTERLLPADIYRDVHQLRPFSPVFFATPLSGSFLKVTVQDNGVGIEPEDHVRIFDKFFEIGDINGHSTSRTRFGGKGVGLGLTLVKGMVESHGGMVWVESTGSGSGSTFHVLLPLTTAQREERNETSQIFPGHSPLGRDRETHTAAAQPPCRGSSPGSLEPSREPPSDSPVFRGDT